MTWKEVALRLLFTVAAGALVGINREGEGRPAGLRTTILVCLAASVAMLQMNFLLDVVGKTSGSFAVKDIMGLPLGILSGMGFIRWEISEFVASFKESNMKKAWK